MPVAEISAKMEENLVWGKEGVGRWVSGWVADRLGG
jgi:hypothetical protein